MKMGLVDYPYLTPKNLMLNGIYPLKITHYYKCNLLLSFGLKYLLRNYTQKHDLHLYTRKPARHALAEFE